MERLSSIFIICLMQVLTMAASTFNLNVEVTPSGAASLNTSGGAYEEGQKVSLRATAHTGFLFQGWYEGEEKVASTLSFTYTMPARDASLQARFNYDPEAPVNPAMPDTCTYYNLTAAVSPEGAASLNLYEGRYKAGASVALRANGRTGYVFDGWCDGSGAIISSSVSFNFTMPARNEQLTALYHYDPAAPANPEQMGVMYSTVLESKPAGGGSFNTSSVSMKEGDNTRLYAYTHPGFRFLRWEDEKGNIVSEKQDFYYVMPKGGGRLFGVFEFDPDPPANPGKNWWDKELGNVIVDDFSPGGLYSALKDALSGSSSDAVGMITVAGVMNNNDFSIANNFGSCTLLDLSRVTGVTEIPSYAFDKTSLESVFIPATVEKIGTRAFENCSQLAKLTIYALTPPVLESYVFRGIPEGLVVYVPGAVVAQYQEAEGWKDFTILPITEDVRSLTVNLPSDVDPKAYAHMWLELRNTKSGQRMHYVMTDRRAYTFVNIIRNTSWEVTLRNERGDVFGQIAEVEVKDQDISVDFASLYFPQTMQLSVITPDGYDVTERVQISWIDSENAYLGQSSTIAGLPEGMEISYQLTLPQDLAMAYVSPSETSCKVDGAANQVKCTLVPIPVVSMSGSVKDSSSGLPVSDALVTASQTFAGKYTKTVTGKTDAQGAFVLKLNEVPTSLTVSSSDYVSRSLVCDSLMSGTTDIALAEIALKPISGAVIALDFKYRNSILQGEEAEEQSWYDDYANISYTIFNKTRNKPVTQFNVQYPVIVLLEEVSDYDQLEITATSLSDRFMPVTDIVTIDEAQK
ncbi:MAG: leucine-rich repeat protein, partial [Muribaculaceae bacterium]|nr:leucine-rich repeat protein [Muribaculaceae bacterium]